MHACTRTGAGAFVPAAPATRGAQARALCPQAVTRRAPAAPVAARRRAGAADVRMGVFGLGFPELAVIAGVGIFIFGPGKISELGRDLGGVAGGLKKASSEFKDAMQESLDEADREIEEKKKQDEAVAAKPDDSAPPAAAKPDDSASAAAPDSTSNNNTKA